MLVQVKTNLNNISKDKHNEQINQVFAHNGMEDKIYPITIKQIVEAQKRDMNEDLLKTKNYHNQIRVWIPPH